MPFIAPIIAGISAAIGTIGTFISGLGILGQVLIMGGLNIAVGYLQKKMNKKRSNQVGGSKIEKEYGQEVSRQVAMGLVGMAGHDLYVNTFGDSNKFFQQIFVLSDYYTSGLIRVNINGTDVAFGTYDAEKGYPVATGDFAGLIWVKYYDGKQPNADSYLVNNANPGGRWTSAHKGVGTSYVIVSMTYDQEKLTSEPQFFFEFYGAPLYDWRKDSTRGGSGPHRLNDVSTHEFTENPIVMEYNYRIGLSVNGDLFCGMNMPLSDLPLDKWTVAANLCDETVSLEPRYRCSMFVDCMDIHGNNIETMTTSCGAMTVEGVTGVWPLVGSSQPIVITFTDDDLIDGQPVRYRARRSMSDLVNSVSGNFVDRSQLWASVGYEPQISATAISFDRRTRDVNIDFPQVYSARQAGQLASIYLKENRYEATATVTLRPRFCVLEVGDWVRWNSARYGNKVYIVTGTAIAPLEDEDGPRNINLSLQERDGSIYDGVSPAVPAIPYPPGTPQYMSEIPFVLGPVTVEGDTGGRQAAIRATWDIIPDVTVVGVEFRYWPVLQPLAVFNKIAGQNRSTITLFTEGVVGETQYAVQSKPITDPERPTVWGPTQLITTEAASEDIYGPIIDAIKDNLEWVSSGTRQAVEGVQELLDYVTELTNVNYDQAQTVRREMISTTGNITARFTEEIRVLTDANTAAVQMTTELSAKVDSDIAAVTTDYTNKINVVATESAAAVSAVTELSAKVDSDIAAVTTDYTNKINVVATESAAAVSAVQQLTVSFDDLSDDYDETTASFTSSIQALTTAGNAQAGRTDSLFASMGGNNAQINIRWAVAAALSGYSSRLALQAAVDVDGLFRQAALFLDVPASTSAPTRIGLVADQIIMTNYANELARPFFMSGGVLYMDQVNISFANIGTLQVGTSNIAAGAISDVFQVSQSGNTTVNLDVIHGTGSPMIYLFYSGELVTTNNQIGAGIRYNINNVTDGGVIGSCGMVNPGVNNNDIVTSGSFRIFTPPSGRTSTRFSISRVATVNLTTSAILIAMVLRR